MAVRFLAFRADVKPHVVAMYVAPFGCILSLIPIVGLYMRVRMPGLEQADQAMPVYLQSFLHPALGDDLVDATLRQFNDMNLRVADAGASFNNGIADLVSSAELAFASMSAGEAAGVVALAVAAGVIVGQSNAQGGNGTVASFSGESAAVRELRAMNEKLGAKVVEIEDKFVAADAAFEANTEAMRKEFDTTLRVKIDTLRSELQRDKEAALKDMQNAHELQLEEMKSFYTDQYAEKVSELQREITERDKRILELEAAAGDPLSRWFKVRGGGERAEPMSPAYSRVTVARGGGGGVPCRHRVLGKEAGSQTPRGRGQRRPSRRARAWRLTRSSPRLRGKG